MANVAEPEDGRASLDVALAGEAEADLLLGWRQSAGAYRVRRVQMDDDLAEHFLRP